MSAKYSSTAVSSHSSTPGFLLSDDYLAADLSDTDDIETLPPLAVRTPTGRGGGRADVVVGRVEDEVELVDGEVDEDGVVRMVVDDETRAQLREIQGALSAHLGGKPQSSPFSSAFASKRAEHDRLTAALASSATAKPPGPRPASHVPAQDMLASNTKPSRHTTDSATAARTTSASPPASMSSLLAVLASKDADLQLAAQLGAALSDKTDTLEQYCRHLEQQLASQSHSHSQPVSSSLSQLNPAASKQRSQLASPSTPRTHHHKSQSLSSPPTNHTNNSGDPFTAEQDASRLRLELGRLERRLAVSETWHRDALNTARTERRAMEERVQELEREAKRREVDETERRKHGDEERLRLSEEVEQLRAAEQQRLARERELRRQREQREKAEADEERERREQAETAEHRWRDEQRRREELERRCRAVEKQRDDAVERAAQQTREFEQRRRRWEEERGRAVDDEVERHRSQAKALADQYRAVEQRMRQHGDKPRTLSVDTSGRASPQPVSPPLSGDEARDRRSVQVSHATQTPGEWMERLDRAASAMTIPKGRGEAERVLYSPLQFTLLSPSLVDSAAKQPREEIKEAATAVERGDGWKVGNEELVIPLSLVTPPRQTVRSPYLSPRSPLPIVVEVTAEDERALVDIISPTVEPEAVAVVNTSAPATSETSASAVSFLSPFYPHQLSSVRSVQPQTTTAAHRTVMAPIPPPATPPRRAVPFSSPLSLRPFFRTPQPTPTPTSSRPTTTATASSPLLFTLHATAHPSSIHAHLAATTDTSPLPPPLLPLSSPFAQLQSALVKRAGAVGGVGRLQPCTDDATKRVFSVLMQTRMGEGAGGFG